MESNPYTTPSANLFGSTSGTTGGEVTETVINHLQRTKGWVKLVGVLMWILFVIVLLIAIGMIAMVAMGGAMLAQADPNMQGGVLIGMGIGYGLFSWLYLYPAKKLTSYAGSIARLMVSRSVADLEDALNQQRGFWKYVGIITVIYLCLIGLFILGLIAIVALGGFAAMNASGAATP